MREYLRYKRLGLRRAWHLANMNRFVWRVTAFLFPIVLAAFLYFSYAANVQAAKDQVRSESIGEIEQLRKIVASCVGPREGSIWIGDKMYLCGIANTGINK